MDPSNPKNNWPTTPYSPRHKEWPYKPSDFTRQDERSDQDFYRSPRFVTHIDDAAIASLREYYATVLPTAPGTRILDFCSSWVSHFPSKVEEAAERGEAKVTGLGMNAAELAANRVLNAGRLLVDLNADPEIGVALRREGAVGEKEEERLDVSTNVVSTDYLTQPVAVLTSLRETTKVGGAVHLVISNRCFPTKAIARWSRVGEDERLLMVADFLHFAGWRRIEIVVLSDGTVDSDQSVQEQGSAGGLSALMAWAGLDRRDPLWVVRAVKE